MKNKLLNVSILLMLGILCPHYLKAQGGISGPAEICVGARPTYTDVTPGGSWSCTSGIASIGGSTGILSTTSVGTVTITYIAGSTTDTKVVTVDAMPDPITGTASFCGLTTSILSDDIVGGNWTSSGAAVTIYGTATSGINSEAFIETNSAPYVQTATITYTLPGGCNTMVTVSVNPVPDNIVCENTPPYTCLGYSAGLGFTETEIGTETGSWGISDPSIATIGLSGVGFCSVQGVSQGPATLTYTLSPGGCFVTTTLYVWTAPTAIAGPLSVCQGQSITLTDPVYGGDAGIWSSSNTDVASIGSVTSGSGSSCSVNGVSAGTSVITYRISDCYVTQVITVNPLPAIITGPTSVCSGQTITLADASQVYTGSYPSGFYNSLAPSIASIDPYTGILTGGAVTGPGTVEIDFRLFSNLCIISTTITVNPAPGAISGPTSVCVGSAISESNSVPGGSWSSSNIAVATIGTDGTVSGLSLGTAIITYMVPGGCFAIQSISVLPIPPPNTGPTTVCTGSAITIFNPNQVYLGYGGLYSGLFSSSNPAVASVNAITGVVTGGVVSSPTTVVISFRMFYSLCTSTTTITVNPAPPPPSGTTMVCSGLSINLYNSLPGGTWSSSNSYTATVGSLTGIVTGVSTGIAIITYMLSTGCYSTISVTVNPTPIISGNPNVCQGFNSPLSAPGTGTWSSSNPAVGSVDGSGNLQGVSVGTAIITFTASTSCIATVTANVMPSPASITGPATTVCTGSYLQLADASGPGTWAATPLTVATVDGTGNVFGVAPGTGFSGPVATITYALGNGCFSTYQVTVLPTPSLITSTTTSVCASGTLQLSDASQVLGTDGYFPGYYTSLNTAVANVNSSTGLITAAAVTTVSTVVITYKLFASPCAVSTTLTVYPAPAAIGGPAVVCVGNYITLTNSISGGTWTSSNTSVATIDPLSGILTGVRSGTSIITYSLAGGCNVTTTVTVYPTPVISGNPNVCQGFNSPLSAPGTGTWSSSNPAVGSVDGSGNLQGVSVGTAIITFTASTSCIATVTANVMPSPASITGPATTVCTGSYLQLADVSGPGTWAATPLTVATVDGTGNVYGVAPGTGFSGPVATITYALGNGCFSTYQVTVLPTPSLITSTTTSMCASGTLQLSDASQVLGTDGYYPGYYTSLNTAVANVNSSTGLVTAAAVTTVSTVVITYKLFASPCAVSTTLTVYPAPAAIGGPAVVCVGNAITLTNSISGGTWTSSNTSVATIDPLSGILTGVRSGTSIITYSLAGGCNVNTTVTVYPTPVISGNPNVCQGFNSPLSAPGTGTWSSSNPAVGSVDGSGNLQGVSVGTAIITFTASTSCIATVTANVMPSPASITGPATTVCTGSYLQLADASGPGTWAATPLTVATVDGTGNVYGVAPGTGFSGPVATITYALGNGCFSTYQVTVLPTPSLITSTTTSMCASGTLQLSDASQVLGTDGYYPGYYTSLNTAVANVNSSTGLVTAAAVTTVSTVVITYKLFASPCAVSITITVNPNPSAIGGLSMVCTGQTVNLTNTVTGGTWSSSNGNVTIGTSSGIALGVTSGSATITYNAASCIITRAINIYNSPANITGLSTVCAGTSITLSDITLYGTWSSSNIAIASISPSSGIVNGVIPGNVTMSYTISNGCFVTYPITVTSLPGILGLSDVCVGQTISLTDATTGGNWTSSAPTIATVSGSGIVRGIAGGLSATITYALSSGCRATTAITVFALGVISGSSSVCQGQFITLSYSGTGGGTWSSSNPAVATVSSIGLVTGITAGTSIISYTTPAGCIATYNITVNALSAINGPISVCAGQTIALTDATSGGVWTSSSPMIANISSGGIVTGNFGGYSVTISYTMPSGCRATAPVSVIALSPITGPSTVCQSLTITLADATPGGTWNSSNIAIATVDGSGNVSGVGAGSVTISYTTPSGCMATIPINVTAFGAITGSSTVCAGQTITLADDATGGTWRSGSPTIASVTSGGVVSGLSGGSSGLSATISYTLGACTAVKPLTVYPVPGISIPGTTENPLCTGTMITATTTGSSGVWSTSNTAIATINSGGVIQGVSAGLVNISYTVGSGCFATGTVMVNPLAPIYGPSSVFVGSSVTLSDDVLGGTWVCHESMVTVNAVTGVVTGDFAGYGPAVILYVLSTGCSSTFVISILDPTPPKHSGDHDTVNLKIGEEVTLNEFVEGGLWSGGDQNVASLQKQTGAITGISQGTTILTYTVSNDAGSTSNMLYVSVNPDDSTLSSAFSSSATSDLTVSPNPNTGDFLIKGSISGNTDDHFTIELTDMLGNVVYKNTGKTSGGKINERVILSKDIANGMYLLNLNSTKINQVFHLAIEQ